MSGWPACTTRTVPWRSATRRGSREDRMLAEVEVSLPARIAGRRFTPGATTARELDRAVRAARALEADHADVLVPLAGFLVRTESVASSKIEHVTASTEDYARALGGVKANPSATSMVSAGRAMARLVASGARGISLAAVLEAHRTLMADDPAEAAYAGRVRDMQNWIGGSDHTPRGAVYVPPPPETVSGYLDDLLDFASGDTVHPVAQAAIVHAQFESIHPFTDGNGRIGRALLGAVFRARGVAPRILVPIASALSADTDLYFGTLTAYRRGDADAIVDDIALCTQVAASESARTASLFRHLPSMWREQAAPRRGSGAATVIDRLLTQPVFTVAQMADALGRDELTVFRAVDRLESAGVIHEVTARKRDRVFAANAVLDELGDLDLRIRTLVTAERGR